ncbi:MAG: glycosyltransferase [Bacteroidales bacterium]|nr:glycosyltransferase [Bacteroidales bacterium]
MKKSINHDLIDMRIEKLTDCVLHSKEMGVTEHKWLDSDIIVSLTTYGDRVFEAYLAIESIMQGSIKPNKIILWLSEQEFANKTLPVTLLRQKERGLEIKFTKDIRSYKKIIPAIVQYPNSYIVTIDDDLIYTFDFLEKLVNSYKEDPNYIYAYRVHKMLLRGDSVASYLDWQKNCSETIASPLYFFTTGGGVLFPISKMDKETLNESVFMGICSSADDVWMNAMVIKSGLTVKRIYSHNHNGDEFYENYHGQSGALWKQNNDPGNCLNDRQIEAVFKKYGIVDLIKRRIAESV